MSERTLKWFGEPWPHPQLRAPVCEDDADNVTTPVGAACVRCPRPIERDDQGVAMPFIGPTEVSEYYWHLQCWLAEVMGDALADQVTRAWC